MFKLLRDSIFNPKKIIYYRAKKVWFVILYMILVGLFLGFAYASKPLSMKPMTFSDRREIIDAFINKNAKIENGVYNADENVQLIVSNYYFTFYKSIDDLKNDTEYTDFAICMESVYFVTSSTRRNVFKISTIVDVDENFKNVDLSHLSPDSAIFDSLTTLLNKAKVSVSIVSLLYGTFGAIVAMLVYALIAYLFLILLMRAGDFMKKSQLYKMLIFASTAVIVGRSIDTLFNLPFFISLIVVVLGFIPLYVLEREIMLRIRMKLLGDNFMNNKSVIDKINNMLKGEDSDDDDSSSDDDEDNNYSNDESED